MYILICRLHQEPADLDVHGVQGHIQTGGTEVKDRATVVHYVTTEVYLILLRGLGMCIIYNRHAKALLDVGGGGVVFILQALVLRRYSTISICDMLKLTVLSSKS